MISTAEVYLWGTRIGVIHMEKDAPYASFEYDRDFAESGIELSPVKMPLSRRVFEFPDLVGSTFRGVPGLIADSLPDRFGNAVINRWLASQGRSDKDFSVLDRLCYTGKRGMGALEYVPAMGPDAGIDEEINVKEMVDFCIRSAPQQGKRKTAEDYRNRLRTALEIRDICRRRLRKGDHKEKC